jgi:protocatechuate 3,4-dioxygenase alpha subunit
MARLTPTPSQTLGPFFAYGFLSDEDNMLAGPDVLGERVTLTGTLKDSEGDAARDALIELWQADAAGLYPGYDAGADAAFKGFGRVLTDADGKFSFHTIMPGASAGQGNRKQAPHFAFGIFAGGLTRRVMTRVYPPNAEAVAEDDVAMSLDEVGRDSITAKHSDAGVLHIDIKLGGEDATAVFTD